MRFEIGDRVNREQINIFLLLVFIISSFCFGQSHIPFSSRSREAINRVSPPLKEALDKKGLAFGAPLFIRIFKEEMILEIWLKKDSRFQLFKSYPICTYGSEGLGPKTRQGDGRAPEGFYFVTPSRLNPLSNFHLSFNLGYPNPYDRYHSRTGGALMVHGSCVSIGCYAMTDAGIEEIYTLADAAFRNGQPFFRVHIFPFKMYKKNMEKNEKSEWYEFWSNLKEGYDFFTVHGYNPPNVEVREGKYVFD